MYRCLGLTFLQQKDESKYGWIEAKYRKRPVSMTQWYYGTVPVQSNQANWTTE